MKRWPPAVLIAVLAIPGCFRVQVCAPHGPPVRLLSREELAAVKRHRRIWFGVAGAVPIDDTQPAVLMAREDLREVRVAVTDTVPDAGIALFHNVFVVTGLFVQTYEIEGNRPPADGAIPKAASPPPAAPAPAGAGAES